MKKLILKILGYFKRKYLPISRQKADFSKTRQIEAQQSRQIKLAEIEIASAAGFESSSRNDQGESQPCNDNTASQEPALICPYCNSKDTVKSGLRKKKYESQQRFLCNACRRLFVAPKAKGKSFPLKIILEAISYYNTGFTLAESCRFLKEKSGLDVKEASLSNWLKDYKELCSYSRMREYGLKLYSPHQVIRTVNLYHRQVYDFSYHRAKTALILQDFRHAKFENVREFLEAVQTECPHQFFQEGSRASEEKVKFDMAGLAIREKQNFATRIANLALQAVNDNKLRHKALQRFMICNDSVTVATEVPVYMDAMDIEHMQEALGFKIPLKLGKVMTGHIDILQIRNGSVHILDYKPAKSAKRDNPVSQLTLYALALSRLTGLRLYDFKCAWFDEHAYFEFFPLHVVYKLRDKAKKDDPRQMKFDELTNAEEERG